MNVVDRSLDIVVGIQIHIPSVIRPWRATSVPATFSQCPCRFRFDMPDRAPYVSPCIADDHVNVIGHDREGMQRIWRLGECHRCCARLVTGQSDRRMFQHALHLRLCVSIIPTSSDGSPRVDGRRLAESVELPRRNERRPRAARLVGKPRAIRREYTVKRQNHDERSLSDLAASHLHLAVSLATRSS